MPRYVCSADIRQLTDDFMMLSQVNKLFQH